MENKFALSLFLPYLVENNEVSALIIITMTIMTADG